MEIENGFESGLLYPPEACTKRCSKRARETEWHSKEDVCVANVLDHLAKIACHRIEQRTEAVSKGDEYGKQSADRNLHVYMTFDDNSEEQRFRDCDTAVIILRLLTTV